VTQRDLDLRHLLEVVVLRARPLQHRVIVGALERHPRRHRDAASLADRQLGHRARRGCGAITHRHEHTLQELRAREGVWELRLRGDAVGLHQRPAARREIELFHAVAHDPADSAGIVIVAVSDDDAWTGGDLHGSWPRVV